MTGLNAPPPQWHFKLDDGEKRIVYDRDSKVVDSGVFRINKADHTTGNLLRMSLLEDDDVLFAGYRNPHPLEQHINVRVRTRPTTTPVRALQNSIKNLKEELDTIEQAFRVGIQDRQAPDGLSGLMDDDL